MNVRAFSVVAATVFSAAAFADGANEWYVDCHAAEGGDGSSASPFRNIPIAVTNAAAGDTIWVRPGVYDSGEMKGQSGSSGYVQRTRVALTKKLFLKSTDGREVTHIVGDQGADRMAYTGSEGTVPVDSMSWGLSEVTAGRLGGRQRSSSVGLARRRSWRPSLRTKSSSSWKA